MLRYLLDSPPAAVLDRIRLGMKVAGALGPRWLLSRSWYEVKKKTGYLRWRTPGRDWGKWPLSDWLTPGVPAEPSAYAAKWKEKRSNFFFCAAGEVASVLHGRFAPPRVEADSILAGHWLYFSGRKFDVGFPPSWHGNPLSGQRAPANHHWSQFSDFDYGDIKLVWEASRFGVVYPLVRAFAGTGEERYAQAFWQLVEDWAEKNPPNCGPNWMSGQEIAFRSLAWCFGLYAFSESSETTPERVAQLAGMLATQAARIESTLDYARSQRNNHILSEATALWTVGLLFPEFRRAGLWRKEGRRQLEEQVRRQIYDDGSYVQHSVNYHRLMLEVLLWAVRLGELNDDRLARTVYDRLERATDFLAALTDPATGEAPNCGSNDGARLLNLTNCVYSDFRPTVQACHYVLHRGPYYPHGDWNEALLWLFGIMARHVHVQEPTSQPVTRKDFHEGGYHLLGEQSARAVIRCARYSDRPGQADQLHMDLWLCGVNVAIDAGTYLYNGAPPWNNGLARTVVHNTVTVDGRDQMLRASRFLWLDWAQGKSAARQVSPQGALEYWQGEHDGYRKLGVTHRRAVLRAGENCWIVVDDVVGKGHHNARLHWLLADGQFGLLQDPSGLVFHTATGSYTVRVSCTETMVISLVRAGEVVSGQPDSSFVDSQARELLGWISRYYACREPALSLSCPTRGHLPIRFVTVFGCEATTITRLNYSEVRLDVDHKVVGVRFAAPGESPILEEGIIRGDQLSDQLVLP